MNLYPCHQPEEATVLSARDEDLKLLAKQLKTARDQAMAQQASRSNVVPTPCRKREGKDEKCVEEKSKVLPSFAT